MLKQLCLYIFVLLITILSQRCFVSSGGAAPGDTIGTVAVNRYASELDSSSTPSTIHQQQYTTVAPHIPSQQQQHQQQQQHYSSQLQHHHQQQQQQVIGSSNVPATVGSHALYHPTPGSGHYDKRNSYNLLSEAMSQAVSNEFSSIGGSGSADGACHTDDLDCYNGQDHLGMEAIRTLHRQLDDDDNGNIDLSESDDFLREELKYDSGYEKRQKAFHFNDDMHISVKELWEAWLRSEVHNWTIEQTTDWLAQSVQLPQYVELFKLHKVTGAALPRLAVNNMHYVGNVLGIKDPIHKQKIALKAMDVVLFGPPRETGTRWKDYILVTLLLSAIIGCWYAYQQNKNAKRHLRRMAQDMEGLQRAEQSLQEMQKELERARMEQENVAMDLERRLKEAPTISSSSSDLEVQQLKKEIEMLRNELSRAEIELVDNCWSPPPQLQSWLQYTYELESKNHLKKRIAAEKQLQSAREACEKLRKKRTSLVGAFVSTHGKSIDDVDRSIVEARNSLGDVTNELQERLHRWKQIETLLGLNIVNNNGLPYLESILYGRNGGSGAGGSNKGSRGRMTSSTDDLDDESVQVKCCDPKAQTWCLWKSMHTCPDSPNSNNNQPDQAAYLPEMDPSERVVRASMIIPLVAVKRWLNNTVRRANNPTHQHHHQFNQHHQQQQLQPEVYQNLIKETHQGDGHLMSRLYRSTSSNLCSTTSVSSNSIHSNNSVEPQQQQQQQQHQHQPIITPHQYHLACNHFTQNMPTTRPLVSRPPPPPHLRPLLRRHTVIPKWEMTPKQQQQQQTIQPVTKLTIPVVSKNESDGYASRSVAKNTAPKTTAATAATVAIATSATAAAAMLTPIQTARKLKPNLHSSHSASCLLPIKSENILAALLTNENLTTS